MEAPPPLSRTCRALLQARPPFSTNMDTNALTSLPAIDSCSWFQFKDATENGVMCCLATTDGKICTNSSKELVIVMVAGKKKYTSMEPDAYTRQQKGAVWGIADGVYFFKWPCGFLFVKNNDLTKESGTQVFGLFLGLPPS